MMTINSNTASNILLVFLVSVTLYSYFLAETYKVAEYKPETVATTQSKRVYDELGFANKKSRRYGAANRSFAEPNRPLVVGEIP